LAFSQMAGHLSLGHTAPEKHQLGTAQHRPSFESSVSGGKKGKIPVGKGYCVQNGFGVPRGGKT